jgi:hypothetical protein
VAPAVKGPPYAGRATHYDTLGLSPAATPEEVRAAYLAGARRFHPDHHGGPDAARRMQEVNAAWAVLGDPDARAAYDAQLTPVEPPPAPTSLRALVPVAIVLALLLAFFVLTAYAGGSR